MNKTTLLVALLILGGCAGNKQPEIDPYPVENLSLATVRLDIEIHIDSKVRWGGVITRVENRANDTWIELAGRNLNDQQRPLVGGVSDGRFIASFRGFVDPTVYKAGRPLTVAGPIVGQTNRLIGDFDYHFPIIAVEDSRLWSQTEKVRIQSYPPSWWAYDLHYHSHFPHRHRRW